MAITFENVLVPFTIIFSVTLSTFISPLSELSYRYLNSHSSIVRVLPEKLINEEESFLDLFSDDLNDVDTSSNCAPSITEIMEWEYSSELRENTILFIVTVDWLPLTWMRKDAYDSYYTSKVTSLPSSVADFNTTDLEKRVE